MEKRNTLLLTVIAVATLLVAVVGATFAYFASDAAGASDANVQVGATATASQALLDGVGGTISLAVTPETMREAAADNSGNSIAAEQNTTLTVNLLSKSEDVEAVCTYNIVWEWTGNDTYVATTGLTPTQDPENPELPGLPINFGKEFTLKLTHDGAENTTAGTSATFAGYELDEETSQPVEATLPIVGNEINVDKLTHEDGRTLTLVTGASITNQSAETATSTKWTVEAKIYNLNLNQSALAGDGVEKAAKNYGGQITITNVVC